MLLLLQAQQAALAVSESAPGPLRGLIKHGPCPLPKFSTPLMPVGLVLASGCAAVGKVYHGAGPPTALVCTQFRGLGRRGI